MTPSRLPRVRRFVCPEDGCDFASLTSGADVWAHAEEAPGIERDGCRCLWAGCGKVSRAPAHHLAHEAVHTGVFPFTCRTCAVKG